MNIKTKQCLLPDPVVPIHQTTDGMKQCFGLRVALVNQSTHDERPAKRNIANKQTLEIKGLGIPLFLERPTTLLYDWTYFERSASKGVKVKMV